MPNGEGSHDNIPLWEEVRDLQESYKELDEEKCALEEKLEKAQERIVILESLLVVKMVKKAQKI